MSALHLPNPARVMLLERVRATFNDPARGETPVEASDDALFAPSCAIRQVHGDVVAMMVGGMRALLMQTLHPGALQGVLDHSDFRRDVMGRLRRTARFIATTTYAHRSEAIRAVTKVNAIHARIGGVLPDGRPYAATDANLLAWVHLAEASSFLAAYLAYGDPAFSARRQDEYLAQSATIARMLGADPVPCDRTQSRELMLQMRGELVGSHAARDVARFLIDGDETRRPGLAERALWDAAVDLLPPFARTMLQLKAPRLAGAPARVAAHVMARSVRWAFAGQGRK